MPHPKPTPEAVAEARNGLDEQVREIVRWHFSEATGCPFWLDFRGRLDFDPLTAVRGFEDLQRFPPFEDDWLRGGPLRRWVPKRYEGRPLFVFETGGTTGIPKSRVGIEDFRLDYERFSEVLPDEHFLRDRTGWCWAPPGPAGSASPSSTSPSSGAASPSASIWTRAGS